MKRCAFVILSYIDTLYLSPFTVPVAVYFDNNAPSEKTAISFTKLSYGETFAAFRGRQTEFSKHADSKDTLINKFFEQDVQGGYDKLVHFCNLLQGYLQNGNYIEMVLQGYASPMAEAEYNTEDWSG